MRQRIVAGNWKMHGDRRSAVELMDALSSVPAPPGVEVVICPPSIYVSDLIARFAASGFSFGGQDLSVHDHGPHTGEIAARMWRDIGCRYSLVGHSERRLGQHENSDLIAEKFMAARRAGIIPILCVGESLRQRDAGQTAYAIQRQLEPVFRLGGPKAFENAVVAYEPVWAIGTGHTATPEQAQEVHALIRSEVRAHDATISGLLPIVYGGSVKPSNASQLFSQPDVDGGLVGAASLHASDFAAIIAAAKN